MSVEQQRELLRAAEDSRPRDRAIITLLFYTALRLHELVALDVEDVTLSARKGLLVVRSGRGNLYREVPLNAHSAMPLAAGCASGRQPTRRTRCSSVHRVGACRGTRST
ncbi:MAG: tyrosine-type recombinase/integrase [Solirubrobacteraceae bacterium]